MPRYTNKERDKAKAAAREIRRRRGNGPTPDITPEAAAVSLVDRGLCSARIVEGTGALRRLGVIQGDLP